MLSFLDKRSALVLPVFVILGFLIYSNTLNVPFHFDDESNIVENLNIRLTGLSLKDITGACFKSVCPNRPVANLSFALNYYFQPADRIFCYSPGDHVRAPSLPSINVCMFDGRNPGLSMQNTGLVEGRAALRLDSRVLLLDV